MARFGAWRRSMVLAVASTLLEAPALAEVPAPVDVIETCASAAESADRLLRASRPVAARKELAACSDTQCPAVVRRDCAALATEADAMQPSLVVSVTRGGLDCPASIAIDGISVTVAPGAPLRLEPGEHHVRAACSDGDAAVATTVLLHAGEKLKALALAVPPAAPTRRPLPPVPVALAGLGLASLATGVAFGLVTLSSVSTLESECAPRCSESRISGPTTTGAVADVLFVGGGILLVSGLALWLTGKHDHAASTRR